VSHAGCVTLGVAYSRGHAAMYEHQPFLADNRNQNANCATQDDFFSFEQRADSSHALALR
jgi:hypothetical protein